MYPTTFAKPKKRSLYKEMQIAGTSFHDLKDVWDELYVGAKLALVRHRSNPHDKNAIAVALAGDYDGNPADFDFDFILGYVPRVENQLLAMLMDMGWDKAFECEISQVEGSGSYRSKLHMKIYVVVREGYIIPGSRLRVWQPEAEDYDTFISMQTAKGYSYFRWGGFPPYELDLPDVGDKVVLMHQTGDEFILYLLHCIAAGDDMAAPFVEDKEMLNAVDDCCFYVLTNVHGPISVAAERLAFLANEAVCSCQPDAVLSESATEKMYEVFGGEEATDD